MKSAPIYDPAKGPNEEHELADLHAKLVDGKKVRKFYLFMVMRKIPERS